MRDLRKILSKNYRVIEFSSKKSFFEQSEREKENFLTIVKENSGNLENTISLNEHNFLSAIEKNSSDIIILNCAGWRELKRLHQNTELAFCFEKITLINAVVVVYFLFKELLRRQKRIHGLYYNKRGFFFSLYLGLKIRKQKNRKTRQYLSPLISLEDFFHNLNLKNINYCILRWFENLPEVEKGEDIDMLVKDNDLTKVYSILDQRPGIVPFDIYSESGIPGSDFKDLPYYVFSLAEDVLNNTILFKDKFKVPTWENYFYLLAYHAVFHKGEQSGLNSERYNFTLNIKPDHDYLHHLKQISLKANLDISDFTLEGLHSFLNSKGYSPPLDTQYKLSLQNLYLKKYLENVHSESKTLETFAGLVCFVIREKIIDFGLLEDVEKFIQKSGFTVIKKVNIKESLLDRFTKKVRGGNWNKGPWPLNAGKPSVLVVAFDVYPIQPSENDHIKHPGLTNKRILNKNEIRDFVNKKIPDKKQWCNGIHSSDNEIQAVEYLSLAGLNEGEILTSIEKYREIYKTKEPIIKVLSRFSKRAKVELISYKGNKAIKKTFKPMCEWFLKNEIEAYTTFRDFKEVPKLLETGDNYLITEYIENAVPLDKKINIRTLKKCLNVLHRIYDKGYTLLDFQPSNFLTDRNKNIYIIDFEFLQKYELKPEFINCFDLVGIPDSYDPAYTPFVHIPKGKKQFEVRWGRETGLYYNDLSKLNNLNTYFLSCLRHSKIKLKEVLSIVKRLFKVTARIMYRIAP